MKLSRQNRFPAALTGFMIILIACNLHLFLGTSPSPLIFSENLVADGEWWRIITHLFVHVSWYHLLLDSIATAFLWHEIELDSFPKKLFIAVSAAAGSLLCAVLFSPLIEQSGYCGLSGLAHGLMFFLGLLWLEESLTTGRQTGANPVKIIAAILLLLASGGKSIVEVVSGSVIFAQIHMGDLGVPIVHAHLGGVLGSLAAYLFLRFYKSKSK
ncbi:MAG: rhomboid family intramembrane serine protease [Deltaproteobacteria bacterium]|nr:rhomboid family intramembrane serine protease [Deltaproteobacteria bacterium]MBW2658697.1 rhomboid family intramembrane serine protease [Deltaproteobacteria bacterium]